MSNFKFIVNPVSGRGRGKKVAEWLLKKSVSAGIDYNLEFTKYPDHAREIAIESIKKYENIVSVGGDGTAQEVANGLYGSGKKFGIIPVGTGNDFIRSLAIPKNANAAFEILLNGKSRKIDIGKANGKYFLNGIGIGFDAWAVEESNKIKYLRGSLVYLVAILKTLTYFKPPVLKIQFDSEYVEQKFFMINIGNGKFMGGGFKLTPFAELNDALLDLNLVSELTKLQIVQNFIGVYSAKHIHLPQVRIAQAKKIFIETDTEFAAQADGELIGLQLKTLEIEIVPDAIEIITP